MMIRRCNMSYTEYLDRIIKASGKSYSEISNESKKNGHKGFTKSYLSQIKTGKNPPASEEINYLIATICGTDPDELQYEAYMENAPRLIHNFIDEFVDFFFNSIVDYMLKNLPRDQRSLINSRINEVMTPYRIVKSIADEGFDKLNIFNGSMELEGFGDNNDKQIVLPSYGFLKIVDESMQPLILKGDKLEIDSSQSPKIGEIGVFKTGETEYMIRRYMEKGDRILLIPDNKEFETKSYAVDEIGIVARVKAIIKEL